MAFKDILGQDKAVGYLRQALAQGRIPSAYLFQGANHVGKRSTALMLAKALNCVRQDGDCCDVCPSCRKIDEEMHPDVDTVRPDGQFIKIGQVRAVSDKLALIPFEARKRVIVLAQADRMNVQSANAFLKTLEEPPQDTLLVLCAEDPARLPETIVSRCVPIRFSLLGDETVATLLRQAGHMDGEALDFAVRFAQGRLRPGLREKVQRWMTLREDLIQAMEGLHRPMFFHVSERFAQWSGSEDWRFVLEWLETWFRDLALLGGGVDEAALINRDRMEVLRKEVQRFTPAQADRCYRRVLATRSDIQLMNANRSLALEALWLGFKQIA